MAKKSGKGSERVYAQREEIVNRVIADMDKGGFEWVKPWKDMAAPHNPITGTTYRGGNRTHLAAMAMIRGYDDPRWVTFKQIQKAGWHLKENQKSCVVEKWTLYRRKVDKDAPDDDKSAYEYIPRMLPPWSVFNMSQLMSQEELEAFGEKTGQDMSGFTAPPPLPKIERNSDEENSRLADEVIAASRCPIEEKPANIAAYYPAVDRITMPPRESFSSNETFLTTMLHEMGHSTGHPSAVGRTQNTQFGSKEYAFEELVAEMSSMFSASDLGLTGNVDPESEHYQQHVAYLQSWREVLSADPGLLFRASTEASKASDFVIDQYEQHVGHEAPGRAFMKELDSQIPDEVCGEYRDKDTDRKNDKEHGSLDALSAKEAEARAASVSLSDKEHGAGEPARSTVVER